ncbi:helix-turn-helix transcriptional regulator [Amycolatopsis thermoflava]|nr:YafY family protein [Amycolatopsis thermoflava]
MRASRLMSMLLLLQARGTMTARELADELEVSVRTVYRDVESLGAAGVPVYGEPGHDGGYRLLDGYQTRLTGLTGAEAESLFLTGVPSAAAELGLAAAVTTAQLKLKAALPAGLRDRVSRIAERFHLDAPSWYHDADDTPHLAAIAGAVWNRHPARIRYLRWAEPHETSRVVEPHGLVLKAGRWYLVARRDGQFRTYRVARILSAEVLPGTFERASGFRLAEYWDTYLDQFDRRRHRDVAVVRLSGHGLERLSGLLAPAIPAGGPGADGWTEVRIPIESVEWALPELLKLGADAEVLAPLELRERIVATLSAMSGLYG